VLGVRTGRAVKKVIPSSLSNKLDIATVSAISSAAVGMLAGPDSLTSSLFDNPNIPALAKAALNAAQNEFAVLMKDLAPGVSIQNGITGRVPRLSASQRNVNGAAEVGGVRMADSGYLDNSAIGFLLRDIQDSKGTASPFNITLWMQSNEAADPVTGLDERVRIAADASSLGTFGLPSEVPQIFGQSKGRWRSRWGSHHPGAVPTGAADLTCLRQRFSIHRLGMARASQTGATARTTSTCPTSTWTSPRLTTRPLASKPVRVANCTSSMRSTRSHSQLR
jgi:hypothetical protein